MAEERIAYYTRRSKAINNPQTYLSLITDEMTKHTTSVPHFTVKTKANDSGAPVGFQIAGTIVHGLGIWGHCVRDEWGTVKSNVACETLLDVLHRVVQIRGSLPDTLYIQADNASSNKNHTVFGLLAMLVHRGVFKEIRVRP